MKQPKMERLQEKASEIIYDYKTGKSLDTLAGAYGMNPSTIRRFLISQNVTLRLAIRPKILERRKEEIISLYRKGWSTKQLADKFKVDRNTVSYFLSENSILRKQPLRKRNFFIENNSDKGMLAAFIMGEGSILIHGRGVIIVVSNQDAAIIGWLRKFGGRSYWYGPRTKNPNPCGTWRLSGAVDVFHCLSSLYPLLLGKKSNLLLPP